jgi:tRNA-dihydrouridine synthase
VEYFGERIGILEFRKHAAEYIKDFPNAKYIRNKIMAADTLHEVQEVIHNEMLY